MNFRYDAAVLDGRSISNINARESAMTLSQHVESYRFWEVVTQWAAEREEDVYLVARAMARGVVREGLRVQSVDSRWCKPGTFELRGAPLVGYVAIEEALPIFIRASALAHLRNVVERAAAPDAKALHEEFVTKQDFRAWLVQWDIPRPAFWYGGSQGDER